MDNGRLEELLERIAEGVEKMASEPEIEIEGGPPLCPSCGKMNPQVVLQPEDGGTGPLGEIAIEAICQHCGSLVIAIPESYSMHRSRETAVVELQQRRKSLGGNDEAVSDRKA